jgi:hypothetical protein
MSAKLAAADCRRSAAAGRRLAAAFAAALPPIAVFLTGLRGRLFQVNQTEIVPIGQIGGKAAAGAAAKRPAGGGGGGNRRRRV